MSKFARIGPMPEDFYLIEPTLQALEEELKRRVTEHVQGTSRSETNWVVHQIDWQRTRYVHDMCWKLGKISQECYQYCVRNKIINSPLSTKWFEKGYERLCSLHAIDSRNFQFGGTSICRVPRQKLRPEQLDVVAVFNGCRGCASGKGGAENIFGNKYGQRLAYIQDQREKLLLEQEEQSRKAKIEEEQAAKAAQAAEKKDKEDTAGEDTAAASAQMKKRKKIIKKKAGGSAKPWAQSKDEELAAVGGEEDAEEESSKKLRHTDE